MSLFRLRRIEDSDWLASENIVFQRKTTSPMDKESKK